MSKNFHVEFALDICKHFYKEKKQFLLTQLNKIGDENWYSFHDSDHRQRKIIYKEVYCVCLPDKCDVIHLISLVKHVKGILIECIYTNNKIIYASNSYSKQMNKDKVRELKNSTKNSDDDEIIRTIIT
tara:strand:- start:162 stop:545 length:384 start_codon:yes stop_codon:yes gene_type:complete